MILPKAQGRLEKSSYCLSVFPYYLELRLSLQASCHMMLNSHCSLLCF